MSARLITAPTELAVTLTDARAHLRVDGNALDPMITQWIKGITAQLEHACGICVMRQTWVVSLSRFARVIPLPHPTISINSIVYRDQNNVAQTLDPALYVLTRRAYHSTLRAVNNIDWPVTPYFSNQWYSNADSVFNYSHDYMDQSNYIKENEFIDITVQCGDGMAPGEAPDNIKTYIFAKLCEQFDPATIPAENTVQSRYIERLLDACKTYL